MAHAKQKSYDMHAKIAIERAKGMLGPGWAHVSDEVRWGLIASNVLAGATAQDETISDAAFRDWVLHVTEAAHTLSGIRV